MALVEANGAFVGCISRDAELVGVSVGCPLLEVGDQVGAYAVAAPFGAHEDADQHGAGIEPHL